MRLPHQPQYAAEYAYMAATYTPDREADRLDQLYREDCEHSLSKFPDELRVQMFPERVDSVSL